MTNATANPTTTPPEPLSEGLPAIDQRQGAHAPRSPRDSSLDAPRRRRRVAPGCLKALAMLMKNPVTSSPLPRLQVSPVRPTGSLTVFDRASGENFSIYTPAFQSLLDGGHRAGLWYARPVNSVGASPVSRGFATAKEAVEALKQGRWQAAEPKKPQASPASRIRIIWPATSELAG